MTDSDRTIRRQRAQIAYLRRAHKHGMSDARFTEHTHRASRTIDAIKRERTT